MFEIWHWLYIGRILSLLLLLIAQIHKACAVTVYYEKGYNPSTTTTTASGANYTGLAAYNPTTLPVPPVPTGFPTQANAQILDGPAPPGSSISHMSSFFGFSIEMSVVDQVLGRSSQLINVPFLNLMGNLVMRAGRVNIRVGGNTQETAVMVQNTTNGKLLQKDYNNTLGTTNSPPIHYKEDLLYIMSNISNFLNVRWFLGIPFNNTNPYNLDIVHYGQSILGEYLIGLQAGNEPDFYGQFGKRPANYTQFDYFGDIGQLVTQMQNDPLVLNRTMLLAPSVATGPWIPEQVWDTGFLNSYSQYLSWLAVEHYPIDNCYPQFHQGIYHDPQQQLLNYLMHNYTTSLLSPYLNSTNIAQQANKPFLMFETNTASCGGFGGISDAFVAALWSLDYALQMAYSNFSMALFHVGGQNVFYNPFTPPPSNQSSYHQWTVGPVYYSALAMAETISNGSQVLDITNSSNLNNNAPAYVIYENGHPTRLALFNMVSDPSGASDIQFTFSIGGQNVNQNNATPAQVKVKYLRASIVTQKGNFTWAGLTFGSNFDSDGRPMGQENITTVSCNTSANTCVVTVPAPSYALVFLSDSALSESESGPSTTFATTVTTSTHLTVDPQALQTSNGHSGLSLKALGSTSKKSLSAGVGRRQLLESGLSLEWAVLLGWAGVWLYAWRIW